MELKRKIQKKYTFGLKIVGFQPKIEKIYNIYDISAVQKNNETKLFFAAFLS